VPAYPIEPDNCSMRRSALRLHKSVLEGRLIRLTVAVSTAYYAVFHAITERVPQPAFPDADAALRQRVRRWMAHADISTVCRW
jgi:hypothetical protein